MSIMVIYNIAQVNYKLQDKIRMEKELNGKKMNINVGYLDYLV